MAQPWVHRGRPTAAARTSPPGADRRRAPGVRPCSTPFALPPVRFVIIRDSRSSRCWSSGLGTGAAATVFTIVDAVVLRPLPYAAPDRLVTIWDTNAEKAATHDPISPVNFMDVRALPVFEDAAAWWRPGINLVDPGLDPARVTTIEVERQPLCAARREAAGRRRLPRRRAAVRAARARSPSSATGCGARATAADPSRDRPAAAAERRALHRASG